MLKDFTQCRVAGVSFKLWWMCWVLIPIIILHGLIGYINVALTAITKTCDINKLREHDIKVCISWLYTSFLYFIIALLQESLEKYIDLISCVCLIYIFFHFGLAVLPQIMCVRENKTAIISAHKSWIQLNTGPTLTKWSHKVNSSLIYCMV